MQYIDMQKANNKYMKNYDKNKDCSFIEYLDVNNLYRWAISQKLSVDSFKWRNNISKFNEDFIKNYDEDRDKGYIFKYSINLPDIHSDLPFLPERMKIIKCNKLVCNLYDKNKYVVHIRSLKQALNHGLILKKIYKVIRFNQEAWLKEYIDLNTELRKQTKMILKKTSLS